MKDILNSYSLSELKKEISNLNIKGYSKLKKSELIELMMKHIDRFSHLKMKDKKSKSKPAPKAKPAPKPAPKSKPAPKPAPKSKPAPKAQPKSDGKDCLAKRSGQPKKPKDRKDYLKQSLKYHPDRNPECPEFAKQMFQKLQQLNSPDSSSGDEEREELKKYFKSTVFDTVPFKFKILDKKNYRFSFKVNKKKEKEIKRKLEQIRISTFRGEVTFIYKSS